MAWMWKRRGKTEMMISMVLELEGRATLSWAGLQSFPSPVIREFG